MTKKIPKSFEEVDDMYEKVMKIFAWISVVGTAMLLVVNLILPVVLAFVISVKYLALWTLLPIMFLLLYAMLSLFEIYLED